ncbi:MAG TPA: hypothetical protein VKL40_06675 [Candidatus Angelobacter sp.]|nr:hypothetical protein [Candidatus Angelobacter sp.]
MALMDAKEYDPRPAQRRWRVVGALAVVVIVGLALWWFFRYWPEEHAVNKFFEALERQDFETAYALYTADPDWKQHPEKHNSPTFSQFKLDWGPSGDYGPITSHAIDCSTEYKRRDSSASGVIVTVTINKRSEPTSLWVQKKTKEITFSPWQALCHPPR